MDQFMRAAIDEAKQGLAEGGIPIGSVLVIDGKIVGRGHNRRVQRGSAILHAEMDVLENAGRLKASDYRAGRALFDPGGLRHAHEGGAALQDPQGCHRRKCHFSRTGSLCAFAWGRSGDPGMTQSASR